MADGRGRAGTWCSSCRWSRGRRGSPWGRGGAGLVGGDPDDRTSYQIADFQRGPPLLLLGALFAAAVLVLGRWRGLAALAALALSFVVLLLFVLPAILAGATRWPSRWSARRRSCSWCST